MVGGASGTFGVKTTWRGPGPIQCIGTGTRHQHRGPAAFLRAGVAFLRAGVAFCRGSTAPSFPTDVRCSANPNKQSQDEKLARGCGFHPNSGEECVCECVCMCVWGRGLTWHACQCVLTYLSVYEWLYRYNTNIYKFERIPKQEAADCWRSPSMQTKTLARLQLFCYLGLMPERAAGGRSLGAQTGSERALTAASV